MKTFTQIERFPAGSSGAARNGRIIDEDPKRPGLYRMGQIQIAEGEKPRRFSCYYGKKNQGVILEAAETMYEVQ